MHNSELKNSQNYIKDISIFSTLMWRSKLQFSSLFALQMLQHIVELLCQQKKEVTKESNYNREDIDEDIEHTYNLSPLKLQTKCVFFSPLQYCFYVIVSMVGVLTYVLLIILHLISNIF